MILAITVGIRAVTAATRAVSSMLKGVGKVGAGVAEAGWRAGYKGSIESVAKESISLIQQGNWPVKTGFSKANFGYDIRDSNRVIQFTNRAHYAPTVEIRTRAASDALYSGQGKIIKIGGKAFKLQEGAFRD